MFLLVTNFDSKNSAVKSFVLQLSSVGRDSIVLQYGNFQNQQKHFQRYWKVTSIIFTCFYLSPPLSEYSTTDKDLLEGPDIWADTKNFTSLPPSPAVY